MELCNAHDPAILVNTLYTEDNLYFNHKPLVKGRTLLIQEYAYMARDNYELLLNPTFFYQLNDDMAYEIGQCKGSYNGKYILIWRKDDDGKWRVYMDSNI